MVATNAIASLRELRRERTAGLVGHIWRFGALGVIVVVFAVLSPVFLSRLNWLNTSTYATTTLILGLGETLVIITGGIDLSVGAMLGVASSVGAVYLSGTTGSPADIAVTCALGIGAATALGLVNGLVVAVLRISPFVATLGMLGVGGGMMLLITNGADVVVPASISSLGNGVWFDWVPIVVLIAAVLCLIVDHVLRRTSFGTHTYAIGSDREAARRAGINLSGHLIVVYTLSGFLSGIAGVLILARNVVGSAGAGQGAELDAIAAVVIGGASLLGGAGSVVGTIVGTLIVSILQTGLVLAGVSAYWQVLVTGVVIVVSVFVQQVLSGEFRTRPRRIGIPNRGRKS